MTAVLATCYRQAGDNDRATALYEKLFVMHEGNGAVMAARTLAELRDEMGDYEGSAKWAEVALGAMQQVGAGACVIEAAQHEGDPQLARLKGNLVVWKTTITTTPVHLPECGCCWSSVREVVGGFMS